MVLQKLFKIATNKNQSRIWIEGAILTSNGFKKGDEFNKVISKDENIIILSFGKTDERFNFHHKIAGTNERPIIDMNGKYLTEFFQGYSKYSATFNSEDFSKPTIIIKGIY